MVAHTKAGHGTVEIDQLNAMLGTQDEPLIVDVRAADVYAKAHLPGAVNIPLESMDSAREELPHGQDQPIVTVCNRGVMSLSGLLLLQSMGYRSVKSLNGGTIGWQEAGLTTNNVDRALVGS